MSEELKRSCALQQSPRLVERRAAVRTLLEDVRGGVTWPGEADEVAREVDVLDISGGGAALLAEDPPTAGLVLRLRLHGAPAGTGPIAGQVVATRPDPSGTGRSVVHVRFARWESLDWLVGARRERRLWVRYPARESRACLTWPEGGAERTIRGDLLNISGGGAAFASDALPPPGVPIWFRLAADAWRADRLAAVESRLVATSEDPSGTSVAHVQFVEHCPMELFDLAVHGGE